MRPSLIDLRTSQWIAMGVLAAVMAKMRGQSVRTMETALVDTAFNVVSYQATTAFMTRERPPRAGSGNPIAAPYQCYEASDGQLLLAAPNQKLWERVVEVLDAPQLGEDPRFNTPVQRSHNRDALETELNARFVQSSVADWVERLSAAGVPATRVYGLEEAVVSDIARERQTFVESDGVPLVRLPWLVDGEAISWVSPAPTLGQHTREVLSEIGYAVDQIDNLVADGVAQ